MNLDNIKSQCFKEGTMLFTKASEYALLSLIYISNKNNPQDVETISKELDISKSFLAKILQNMARDGILNSFKGANGGFMLSDKPENITLLQIIESAEKHDMSIFDCSRSKESCAKSDNCQIWCMFNNIQKKVDSYMSGISLNDIIKKS